MKALRRSELKVNEGMARIDKFHQPPAVHMRIYLRRRNVGMAQHRLKRAQIGAPLQQMGCKGVAQAVYASGLGHAGAALCRGVDLLYGGDVDVLGGIAYAAAAYFGTRRLVTLLAGYPARTRA